MLRKQFLAKYKDLPEGQNITIPLMFADPYTLEAYQEITNLLMAKRPAQLHVVGLEVLANSNFALFEGDYAAVRTESNRYSAFETLKWLLTQGSVGEVIFHFGDIDSTPSKPSLGRQILEQFCEFVLPYYKKPSPIGKPFIACAYTTTSLELSAFYQNKFRRASLRAHESNGDYFKNVVFLAFGYYNELGNRYFDHHESPIKAVRAYTRAAAIIKQHFPDETPPLLLLGVHELTRTCYEIGMKHVEESHDAGALFTALYAFMAIPDHHPLYFATILPRVECVKKITRLAISEEKSGNIMSAFDIYETLNKSNAIVLYERPLFLLRHHDNANILASLKKTYRQHLQELLFELQNLQNKAMEIRWYHKLVRGLEACQTLLNQFNTPQHQPRLALLPPPEIKGSAAEKELVSSRDNMKKKSA